MQLLLPISRNGACRSGHRLIQRMMIWPGQPRPIFVLFALVVPEPILPGLKTLDYWVSGLCKMFRGVLRGRIVTTSHMPALGASPQMKPPTPLVSALNTALATRFCGRIDSHIVSGHAVLPIVLVDGAVCAA